MDLIGKKTVEFLTIRPDDEGQRLDNYLFRQLKGVPKSHVYRLIRSGELRVNKKRARADTRLMVNDEIRIPPLRRSTVTHKLQAPATDFEILYEDAGLLAINKPAGMAVHGGSGISFGAIERIRSRYPEQRYLELVHRLDKETSGILLLAKKRSVLRYLHQQWRQGQPQKIYWALCVGTWPETVRRVNQPLYKYTAATGEKMVRVREDGQNALTLFRPLERFKEATLVEATLKTGRTHQIRVHMQSVGCPILGDERYGDYVRNRVWREYGLQRMFLHAAELAIQLPDQAEKLHIRAPLPGDLVALLQKLRGD